MVICSSGKLEWSRDKISLHSYADFPLKVNEGTVKVNGTITFIDDFNKNEVYVICNVIYNI